MGSLSNLARKLQPRHNMDQNGTHIIVHRLTQGGLGYSGSAQDCSSMAQACLGSTWIFSPSTQVKASPAQVSCSGAHAAQAS